MSGVICCADDIVARSPVNYFHESHWGDQFLCYTPFPPATLQEMKQEIEHLKEVVKRELLASANKPLEQLILVDATERLGVAYHFEKEIEEILQQIFERYHQLCDQGIQDDDLHVVSTGFRILRQHGFFVPCDVFKKFKDNKGSFKGSILVDVQGILSLYEASHVRIHGDDILDEACKFTTFHLKSMVEELSSPLAEQVAHALHQPIHKGFIRLESRYYIDFYEQDAFHNKTLLKLAKLDFNLLQSLHRRELCDLFGWWKDFHSKVPYVRDRFIEGYFWILGCYYEHQYADARRMFIKIFVFLQSFDDTFDAYGTYDILKLLVEAIHKWDYSYTAQLPEYFNSCFQIFLETVDEIEKELLKEGRSYAIDHLKLQLIRTCDTWLQEAKWLQQKIIPKYDEYMEVAIVSIGYSAGLAAAFLGMGPIATKESFDWLFQEPMPKLVEASFTLFRLMNDVAGTKFEQASRDHVASSIQCYMKENNILDEEQAYQTLEKKVEDSWKDFNQMMLRPYKIPKPLLDRILHLNRAADVFYKGRNDGYTNVTQILKDQIASILLHPIPL